MKILVFIEHDIIEQAILLWNLVHCVLLRYREKNPGWIFVRHEDLPEVRVDRLVVVDDQDPGVLRGWHPAVPLLSRMYRRAVAARLRGSRPGAVRPGCRGSRQFGAGG